MDVDWDDVLALPEFEGEKFGSAEAHPCFEIADHLIKQGDAYWCFCCRSAKQSDTNINRDLF